MKLTNKTGLPEPLVRVAEKLANNHPVFDKDKYSVTEVLKSTRQVVLAREHASEIEQDIQDTFSMWNGTAIHALLESEAVGSEYEAEQRIEAEIDGVVISGGFDLFYDGDSTLYDYKTSKVATIERQRKLEETKWLEQLYLYKILRGRNGMSVPKKGVIIAMATDFSKIKAGTQMGYPEHPIQMLEWELNDKEFEEATLKKAVDRAKESRGYLENGNEPPLCTYSDCWCTEDYAIIKHGGKRADKVFKTADEAFEYFFNKDDRYDRNKYSVYHRVSDYKNCRNYCPCAPFCEQWKGLQDHEEICEDITDKYVPF